MPDERYTFETARIRLEEIAAEVRKKDTSLEKSLDLLEEGVRLANICTELVDHTDLGATIAVEQSPATTEGRPSESEPSVTGDGTEAEAFVPPTADDEGARPADAPTGDTSQEGAAAPRLSGDEDQSGGQGATDDPDTEDEDEGAGNDSDTEDHDDPAPGETGSFDDTEDDLHEPGEAEGDD